MWIFGVSERAHAKRIPFDCRCAQFDTLNAPLCYNLRDFFPTFFCMKCHFDFDSQLKTAHFAWSTHIRQNWSIVSIAPPSFTSTFNSFASSLFFLLFGRAWMQCKKLYAFCRLIVIAILWLTFFFFPSRAEEIVVGQFSWTAETEKEKRDSFYVECTQRATVMHAKQTHLANNYGWIIIFFLFLSYFANIAFFRCNHFKEI